ncbi:MAG: hypothetical protein WB680_12980 [Candidatus Acidiferrales bacterium]
MNAKIPLLLALVAASATPLFAGHGDKKKPPERATLERMEAVPCGAKEKGITGLGTLWASAGITHVNSDEKMCPQYTVLSDEMEYDIRPADLKHAVILPVGKEIEFKIKKDRMYLKVPDAHQKMQTYEVISMKPANSDASVKDASNKSDSH